MTTESLSKNHWLVPLVLALVSYPTWLVLTSSPPIYLLVPILLAAFWILIRRGQFLGAGLITGLCLVKLEYVPMLLISGLILGRLRYLAGFVVSLAALYFASQQIPWVSSTFNMPPGLAPLLSGGLTANLMQSFSGLLVLLLGDSYEVQMASLAVYALLTVCVAELWWRLQKFPLSDTKYLKASAVTILFMLIGSPHTFAADYIAVVPAAVWLWQATANDTRDSAGTIRKMIIAFPILSWIFFIAQPIFLMLRLPPYFLWATSVVVLTLAIMEDKPDAHILR